jgi:hypothetical protein
MYLFQCVLFLTLPWSFKNDRIYQYLIEQYNANRIMHSILFQDWANITEDRDSIEDTVLYAYYCEYGISQIGIIWLYK